MRAWKCDRCGKLFAQLPSHIKFNDVVINQIRYGTNNFNRSADLCPECIADFVLWFKEPALAAITNEGE